MSKHGMTNPKGNQVVKGNSKGKGKKTPAQISLAPETAPAVTSESNAAAGSPATDNQAGGTPPAAQPATARSMTNMDLTLTRSKTDRKSKRLVIYNIEGRTGSVQFLSTLFGGSQTEGGNPPETLTLSGEFAEPKVAVAKIKETPEERKVRLAALPKPTLAEKVAKAEERAAALRAKLAKANAPVA